MASNNASADQCHDPDMRPSWSLWWQKSGIGNSTHEPGGVPHKVEPSSVKLEEQSSSVPNVSEVRRILDGGNLSDKEQLAEAGCVLLQDLAILFRGNSDPMASDFVAQIENMFQRATKTKTLIGILGNTGAGKSSIINALLDEERIVPEGCMGACTAVATKIAYNHKSADYRAEIKFLTLADWEDELNVLRQEVFDGKGNLMEESRNRNSEANVAYEKLRALYPDKTDRELADSTIDDLVHGLDNVLGTTVTITESEPANFYRVVNSYVAISRNKPARDGKRAIQYWPLIRVVKMYVRSRVLKTGAILVDLPGLHDVNTARVAVAQKYRMKCTALLNVVPIARAIDDTATEDLLFNDASVRQIRMDGLTNSVGFVCSKTDDYNSEQLEDALGISERYPGLVANRDQISEEKDRLQEELDDLMNQRELDTDTDAESDDTEGVEKEDLKGYVPESVNLKRQSPDDKLVGNVRKKLRLDTDVSGEAGKKHNANEDQGHQKTDEPAPPGLHDTSASDQEPRSNAEESISVQDLTHRIEALNAQIADKEKSFLKAQKQITAFSIFHRNEISTRAIKESWRQVQRQGRPSNQEEDEETSGTGADVGSLPVFCVSSYDYQKLRGRLRREPKPPVARSCNATQIPQLQNYCRQLTESGRTARFATFWQRLRQTLTSIAIWALSDQIREREAQENDEKVRKLIQDLADDLKQNLNHHVAAYCDSMLLSIQDGLFKRFDEGVQAAEQKADETVEHWNSTIRWITYKAICRREGTYKNRAKNYDWNLELTEPLVKCFIESWTDIFVDSRQEKTTDLVTKAKKALQSLCTNLSAKEEELDLDKRCLERILVLMTTHNGVLEDDIRAIEESVDTEQRVINRQLFSVVSGHMKPIYRDCSRVRGNGSAQRMFTQMNAFVDQHRSTMFKEATHAVRTQLLSLMDRIRRELTKIVDDRHARVTTQIQTMLRTSSENAISQGPSPLQAQVLELLDGVQFTLEAAMNRAKEARESERKIKTEDADVTGTAAAHELNAMKTESS